MYRLLLFLCIVIAGCGTPSQFITSCTKPAIDFTWFRAKNLDQAKIYMKYTATSSGNIIANVSGMKLDSIMPGQTDSFELRSDNDNFNHYYFYTDRNASQEIGKLILKNTNPTNFGIPIVNLKNTGSFTSSESHLNVSTLIYNRSYCVRYIQVFDWQRWLFNYPSPGPSESAAISPINCTEVVILSTVLPTDKFQHLYFYNNSRDCNAPITSEDGRIIYRNTKSAKINIPKIFVLD